MPSDYVIELRDVNKSFPGVKALSGVNLAVKKGEVHALVGENGAGKSTLIKVITGFHKMDSGVMLIDGEPVEFASPHESIEAGIACIYQELSIVPQLDVAKNIFLGNWPEKGRLIDRQALYKKAEEILQRVSLNVKPQEIAGDLSIAQQQMVEIGRALTRDARIIIMDEPTSSLTEKETEALMKLIEKLRSDGISIIYISHKLEEVLNISDRITVMCDGRYVASMDTKDTSRQQLIEAMLGRPLDNMYEHTPTKPGEVVLKVENLTREGVFRDVSFEVRAGEILGFFGLVGAGRSEIMRALFGIDKYQSGNIYIKGQKVNIRSPKDAVALGMALVPEDRKNDGLALQLSVLENMTLVKLPEISKAGIIDQKTRRTLAEKFVESVRVKTPSVRQLVGNLSGGNQQKVIIARWLMQATSILILDEPTRGIDVGSKAEIYSIISDLAAQGVAVIIVSSEMNEVLGVSDRVAAVFEGRITKVFETAKTNDKEVLSAALGGEGV